MSAFIEISIKIEIWRLFRGKSTNYRGLLYLKCFPVGVCPECVVPDVNVLQHEILGSHTKSGQAIQEEGDQVFQNMLEINMICILHQM